MPPRVDTQGQPPPTSPVTNPSLPVNYGTGDPNKLTGGPVGLQGANLPTGPATVLPWDPSQTAVFDPATLKVKFNRGDINRGPFPGSQYYNPYGWAQPMKTYGRSGIYGGAADMIKSIQTRGIALAGMQQELGRPTVPTGLMEALGRGAGQLGGQLGAEEFGDIAPGITTQFATYEDQYKAGLSELLNKAYILGGGIYGAQTTAWAQAKAQDSARRAEHARSVNAIVGGAIGGLTGGGGGGLGGGMGGGGGGGGDYGSGNVTGGLITILGEQGVL